MNEQEMRENVIKGLECCTKKPCIYKDTVEECPYCDMCDEYFEDCTTALAKDALALLKAQEPMKPIENAGFYYCGACRYVFTSARQKYCFECGRKVKWE